MDAHLFCFIVEEKKMTIYLKPEHMVEIFLKLAAAVENAILFSSISVLYILT